MNRGVILVPNLAFILTVTLLQDFKILIKDYTKRIKALPRVGGKEGVGNP